MVFQVAEPTLSPEVANLLESFLGCKIAREGILQDRKQFDFFVILDSLKIVVELKIGGFQKLPVAIAQAEDYKERIGADGIVAIVYPDEARKEVTRPDDVRDIALGLRPTVMVLCPFLKDYYPQVSLAELAKNLKGSLTKPTLAPSVDLVVEALRQSVQGISLEVKRSAGVDSPIIKETVGSLVLFEILSQESGELDSKKAKDEAVKGIVADLAGYILVNQLLLHHILSTTLSLPRKLKSVSAPVELNAFFKEIQDIDYRAVYCIDIASNIPLAVTTEINIAITAIRAMQPENLRHDLLGRIFHEFLPPETRKQLGAFYTRPQAAEILAGLAIDHADEKVLDPACGSGTLLVSAYRKKSSIGKVRFHRKLVEEELTGVDIMPFAAHLTALNLTMQSPMEVTNKTRVGIGNSLHLARGDEIGDVTRWMRTFGGDVTGVEVEEPLTKGEMFKVEPANVVIMNPPFTRKERLTPAMKGIGLSIFGEQNYWAYFIALADLFLRKNGKIAAVLPRDFFRGEYSRAVREFLFKEGRYGLRYVVKSTKDTAFSEGARFRDFLIVFQKDNTQAKCAFVYLKKKLSELSMREAFGIPITVSTVDEGETFEDESLLIIWKDQSEIRATWQDLGQLVAFNTAAGEKLLRFYSDAISRGNEKITRLENLRPAIAVRRGLTPWIKNLLNLIFIVRPIDERRIGYSKIILISEAAGQVMCKMKDFGTTFEIPRRVVKKGLKTAAYIPTLDVEAISDLVILKSFDGLKEIQQRLGIKAVNLKDITRRTNDRFAHLFISRRFNFAAPGTKALSFFSTEKLLPGEAFWVLPTDVISSKVLCMWFNSTLAFIELLLSQRETEGSFIDVTSEKIIKLHTPDFSKCNIDDILEAFEKVRYAEFPPLVDQFENPPEARVTIDRAVLRAIGYGEKEINVLLPEIYDAMATEMRSWKELMHKSPAKETEPSLQLHLLPTE
jgi:hypothetical protein